ncbi:MAG: hypothetical protein A3K22_04485 [Deltaproteobacteria bacterium RBG_16_42_7]|nr:MAG: hypothetical protein A3K22_04485 [Deltaproteobacteria bacterium RBG_16_42_7]
MKKKKEEKKAIPPKYRIALTKHPPEGDLSYEEIKQTSAYIPEPKGRFPILEDDFEKDFTTEILLLDFKKKCFEREKEFVSAYAIEAFITAHKAGLYPPMWALNYIVQVFSDWYKLQGTKSLDKLFELNWMQHQRYFYFEKGDIDKRDIELCQTMFALRRIFGITIKQASCMAVVKHGGVAATTIEGKYKKGWGKIFKGKYYEVLHNHYSSYTVDKKIRFLKSFPLKNYPPKIQRWLAQFSPQQLKNWGIR